MADDHFTIQVGGEGRDIKMSFGLLNSLCRKAGDIDGAAMVALDQDLREAFLVELLSPRDARGKIKESIDPLELDVEVQSVLDLIDWAGNHVMDFFLMGLERTKALQDRNMDRIKALMPTSTGSAS